MFPHSFAQHNLSKCVGEMKLEGPSGWVWPCSLEKDGDSMLLTKPGWEKFSLDHNLKEGDTLLFTYVGRNLLNGKKVLRKEGIAFQVQSSFYAQPMMTKDMPLQWIVSIVGLTLKTIKTMIRARS